jgi:hypothetical protein
LKAIEKSIRSLDMVSGAIPTKSGAFFAQIFFRKIFFLFILVKRQTFEVYGKFIRDSDMVSGVLPTKRNAFFA